MFLAPPRPEVELGTVSFKSKMDEVIKNFCQYWPIYDLPFEVVKDEDEEAEKDSNDNKNKQPKKSDEEEGKNSCRQRICSIDKTYTDDDPNIGLDYIDGGAVEHRLLTANNSIHSTLAEKLKQTVVNMDQYEVDIAVCLPSSWPEARTD